jgi:hypothetical protein
MPPRAAAAAAARTTSIRVHTPQIPHLNNSLTFIGVEFLNKKAGTNISRDNQEKASDFARSQYEKSTG